MSISRPFSYNPTLQTEGVSEQFGDLSVGFTGQTYGDSPGGLKWWEGPDEELGYVIATVLPVGGILAPDGIYGDVTFWRTNTPSESEFITLSNELTGQNFSTSTEATQWLNSNGYWVSFVTPSQLYNILVGGVFTSYQSPLANYITALNTDGTYDTNFNIGTGFDNSVKEITIQSDGKVIVGGSFNEYLGNYMYGIARINSDGTYDSTFNNGGDGFGWEVNSISIQSDEKIIVGGQFQSYNGSSSNYIIRLNTDGSKDTSFSIGTGFNGFVNSTQIQSDGKILVGGAFTTYNELNQNNIVRLNTDGSVDTSFSAGTGFNSVVYSIKAQSDGKILVGGGFTQYNGELKFGIIRLNSDGSVDVSFNAGVGFNGTVRNISLQSDGKIIANGTFSEYNAMGIENMARINTDGSLDTSFNTYFTNGATFTSSIQTDGKIIVGGFFTNYSGVSVNHIVRLNSNGTLDTSFETGTGFDYQVNIVKVGPTGRIYVGGEFNSYNPTSNNRLVSIENNGELTPSFNIGSGFDGFIRNILTQSDGKLIVLGSFNQFDNNTSVNIVRLNTDGSFDSSFNSGTGFNSNSFFPTTYGGVIQSDGKMIVGGLFETYNGTPIKGIVRLNSDGSLDVSFNIILANNIGSERVSALSPQSDGKILIGGTFDTVNGMSYNGLVRLNIDGSVDTSFNVGTGFNSGISSIDIQSDGKILITGTFDSYSGISVNRIVRLNTDGSIDSSFNVGTGPNSHINQCSIQSDGKVIVGGFFTTFNGVSSNKIVRLNVDGSVDTSFNVGTGFNDYVNTLSTKYSGKILVGGIFTDYNGTPSKFFVGLNYDGTIDSTLNIGTGFDEEVTYILN